VRSRAAARLGPRVIDSGGEATLWCESIRYRGLQQLVRAACALPIAGSSEPTEAPRLAALEALVEGKGEDDRTSGFRWMTSRVAEREPGSARPRPPRISADRLRRSVAGCLTAMERLVEGHLTAALTTASHAWDGVDSALAMSSDPAFAEQLRQARRQLDEAAACSEAASARAVALEGLVALELAAELLRLFERRLSSLIRLRALSGQGGLGGLLPDGRPFLDLAAALRDAARAWS